MVAKQNVFVICPPRSGSNLLCKSLNQHSQVCSFGEKLQRTLRGRSIKEAIKSYESKTEKPVVCFKTLYSQFTKIEHQLYPLIEEQQSVVFLLRRKNLLQQFISLAVAFETSFAGRLNRLTKPIVVDIKPGQRKINLSDWVESVLMEEARLEGLFPNSHRLIYEELVKHWDHQLREVQRLIGVPIEEVYQRSNKQIRQPYRQLIRNYDQVKNWFVKQGYLGRM